ncbi:unnamed protein product [Ilex paraguariensis]|uniref:RING-type E3 ubiquitin transferase n=1 Tax=Ilex paraguariensis TaxID=185542 RepID=A0ABC8UFM5_9AQUA
MGDSGEGSQKLNNDSPMLQLTGKIMLASIIVLFLVVAFVFFLHLYARWSWYRREEDAAATGRTRRRRRFEFAPGQQDLYAVTGLRRGLDPSVLESIPVVSFTPKDFKDGLECAVCLCEVSEGEKARLLPKCNHGFHVDCIDMWFQSHSTCPICRNPISNQSSSKSSTPESNRETIITQAPNESPNFPTNVLFWGDETQVSTLDTCLEQEHLGGDGNSSQPSSSSSSSASTSNKPDGTLVIDIPRHINEEEEPKSPMTTRLRSLKRLLSRDRRMVSPRSTSNVDVEQGSRDQN